MKHESPKLLPAREVRARFGITAMSEWRWLKRGILPQPVKINGRNYYPEQAIAELQAKGADAPKVAA